MTTSRDYPGYRFEREEDGTIIVRPTHDSNIGFAIGPLQRGHAG
jgi:hypothetical protein